MQPIPRSANVSYVYCLNGTKLAVFAVSIPFGLLYSRFSWPFFDDAFVLSLTFL